MAGRKDRSMIENIEGGHFREHDFNIGDWVESTLNESSWTGIVTGYDSDGSPELTLFNDNEIYTEYNVWSAMIRHCTPSNEVVERYLVYRLEK